MLGELLVNDGDQFRVRGVRWREKTPGQEWNTNRLQIVTLHRHLRGEVHTGALGRDIAFCDECRITVAARSRQKRGQPCGLHAGELLQTANQFVIEFIHHCLRCVLFLRQRVGGRQDMVRAEAEINGTHLLKTPKQQTGGRQQYQRDGDFTNHQRRAQPGMPPARRARSPPFLEGLVDARPQGGEGRSQSANDAGQYREHDREQHDLSIEADFLNTRQRFGQ